MNALILVDIQNDFCPGGALEVTDGDTVIKVANRLMGRLDKFDLVVATQDWHPSNHKSFASQHPDLKVYDQFELNGLDQTAWPDHCIEGTTGAEFVSSLHTKQIERVFHKGTNPEVDSYSGFFDNDHKQATGLGDFLKENKVTEVFVMGLATDYCVKFTALDAVGIGFKTNLILDGCRGVELAAGDIEASVDQMKSAGVKILNSDEV